MQWKRRRTKVPSTIWELYDGSDKTRYWIQQLDGMMDAYVAYGADDGGLFMISSHDTLREAKAAARREYDKDAEGDMWDALETEAYGEAMAAENE